MAFCTINDVPVLNGTIVMPRKGVWVADVVIDQPDGTGFDVGTAVTIDASGFELSGTVVPGRTGSYLDAVHVIVKGGSAGMQKAAQPRSYVQPGALLRDAAEGIARDAGETLSDTIASELLNRNLVAWAVLAGPCASALEVLLETIDPSLNWRILSDGSLWFGAETWPAVKQDFELIDHDPSKGTYVLGSDEFLVTPGVELEDVGQVNRVEHTIERSRLRSMVWVSIEDEDRGVKPTIKRIVDERLHGIDYFALYDAKLVSQSADNATVDLHPTDSRLPGMTKVPLRHGIPGLTVQVAPGATLRLGWDNGDPSKPYACLWNGGETVISEVISATLLKLGASAAADAVVKGTTYRTQESIVSAGWLTFFEALRVYVQGIQPIVDSSSTLTNALVGAAAPPAPIAPASALGALQALVVAFEAASATYLSTQVKTV